MSGKHRTISGRRWWLAVWLMMLLGWVLVQPASVAGSSPPDEGIEAVGHLAGQATTVAIENGYAYVGLGAEFAILDISNPANPNKVGFLYTPWEIADIFIAGNYAYTANYHEGLHIIDISNPASPVEVGVLNNPDFFLFPRYLSVVVANGYAYLSEGHCAGLAGCFGGLSIVDVTNPAEPVEVGAYPIDAFVTSVAVVGQRVYLVSEHGAGFAPAMRVIDVSNPANPIQRGLLNLPDNSFASGLSKAYELVINGRYAYITDYLDSGFYVVDISNPTQPRIVGRFLEPQYPQAIAVSANRVYVTGRDLGLKIVDVSNPANPTEVATYPEAKPILDLAVNGTTAYLSAGTDGFRIVDFQAPATPVEIGRYDILIDSMSDVVAAGDYAYLVGGTGLRILDISAADGPVEVGRLDQPGSSLALQGQYLYMAAGSVGLQIVEITDPTAPQVSAVYSPPGSSTGINDVAVVGDYAYVAAREAGMRVVDISDPLNPNDVGGVDGYITRLVAAGDRAYIYDSQTNTIYAVDISTPTPVKFNSTYSSSPYFLDMAMDQNDGLYASSYFYATPSTGATSWVDFVDFSDPANPVATRLLYMAQTLFADVTVVDHYVALSILRSVCLYDVADVNAVREIGCYPIPGIREGYLAMDDHLYTVGDDGFYRLRSRFGVEGRVKTANGLPVNGVTMALNTGQTTTTDNGGSYSFQDLPIKTYDLTPSLSNYRFEPTVQVVDVPAEQHLQTFTLLPLPVSDELNPGAATTLSVTGFQSLTTQLTFPTDAVSQTTTIILTPTLAMPPAGFALAGQAFELAAYQQGVLVSDLVFGSPVSFEINYSNQDIRVVSQEEQLDLFEAPGSLWQPANQPCAGPETTRDPANNRLNGSLCRAGKFALLGPTNIIYLPRIFGGK